jgi:hypothetical protein
VPDVNDGGIDGVQFPKCSKLKRHSTIMTAKDLKELRRFTANCCFVDASYE